MAKKSPLPQRVLTEAIVEAIGAQRVTAAVFVTYQLEPGFFEGHVLAPIMGIADGGTERVRAAALDGRLTGVPALVLYSMDALGTDASPHQRVRLIPVDPSKHGLLHAKHVILRVESVEGEDKNPALIFATTSANLTPSGWWINVEVADVERIGAGESHPMADDLAMLLTHLRELAGEEHAALQAISDVISSFRQGSAPLPRLWLGREPLSEWLAKRVPTGADVELIAPFVDQTATPVKNLHDALNPATMRVMLPYSREEQADEDLRDWLAAVESLKNTQLGRLDLDRGLPSGKTRFVHAKTVRIRTRDGSMVLLGSPNLTRAAHTGWKSTTAAQGGRRPNIETAILRRFDGPSAWLKVVDGPLELAASPGEQSPEHAASALSLRLRFDWSSGKAEVLTNFAGDIHLGSSSLDDEARSPSLTLTTQGADDWEPAAPQEPTTTYLRSALITSAILRAWSGLRDSLVLVEQTELQLRPPTVGIQLTPADILQHWSLLNLHRRDAHHESILKRELGGEDGDTTARPDTRGTNSMFDRVVGILHAFLMLRQRVEAGGADRQARHIENWVLGKTQDSLWALMKAVRSGMDDDAGHSDPVHRIVIAASARELLEWATKRQPELMEHHGAARSELDEQIAELETAWGELEPPDDLPEFRTWWSQQWKHPGEADV